MTRRKVTASRKGKAGKITGLAGPSFGFLSAEEVIQDIRDGTHTYLCAGSALRVFRLAEWR